MKPSEEIKTLRSEKGYISSVGVLSLSCISCNPQKQRNNKDVEISQNRGTPILSSMGLSIHINFGYLHVYIIQVYPPCVLRLSGSFYVNYISPERATSTGYEAIRGRYQILIVLYFHFHARRTLTSRTG